MGVSQGRSRDCRSVADWFSSLLFSKSLWRALPAFPAQSSNSLHSPPQTTSGARLSIHLLSMVMKHWLIQLRGRDALFLFTLRVQVSVHCRGSRDISTRLVAYSVCFLMQSRPLPSVGTTRSGLGLPPSITSQDNVPRTSLMEVIPE